MSPARRRLLLALALVVVVAGAAVLAVRLSSGSPTAPTATAPQDRPGPVLLVPGYGGSTDSLQVLATALRAKGRNAQVVKLPGDATGDLRQSAQALTRAADAALAAGAPSVDVVGYSAGGVVARLWAKDHAGQVRRVVMLGAPNHGTSLAATGAVFLPGACPTACQQLVPGSDLLDALNAGDETPAGPQWLSLWTEQDQTVTPPSSASLQGAVDVDLQQVCPRLVVSHSQLPRDPTVTRIVEAALSTAPLTAPGPGVCVSS